MDFVALKAEINTDPATMGYAAPLAAKNDGVLAGLLNNLALGTSKGLTVQVEQVNAALLQGAVVAAEFIALTQPQRDLWQCILIAAQTGVPVRNPGLRLQLIAIWGVGTATRTALVAMQARPCTRAEFLFGDGVQVTVSDVAQARVS